MQIEGYFNARDEPVIGLAVGPSLIEVLVDTGFNGSLIIPTPLAKRLDLKFETGFEEFYSVTGEMFFGVSRFYGDWLARAEDFGVCSDVCRSQRSDPWKPIAQGLPPHHRLSSAHCHDQGKPGTAEII